MTPQLKYNLLRLVSLKLFVLLLLLCIGTTAALGQQNCSFDLILSDLVPSVDPVDRLTSVRSLVECASRCLELQGPDCRSLAFSGQSGDCRVYAVFNTSDVTVASPGYRFFKGCHGPASCLAHYQAGNTTSGVYDLDPDTGNPFQAFCDMTTDGGGWTVFQRRQDGSVDFSLTWADYQQGFGSLEEEHWLGITCIDFEKKALADSGDTGSNDHLHRLTAQGPRELRVELVDWKNQTAFAVYHVFSVGDASSFYTLTVSGYNGTAGDALSWHSGLPFTTKDGDHDTLKKGNCAVSPFSGGWWYKACAKANLNAVYGASGDNGLKYASWFDWKWNRESLQFAEMKLR